MQFSGTFFVTTAPAPIIEFFPISIPGKIIAFSPIQTFSHIFTGFENIFLFLAFSSGKEWFSPE